MTRLGWRVWSFGLLSPAVSWAQDLLLKRSASGFGSFGLWGFRV